MKISVLTIGAMGDTYPFVALAARLKSRGHAVRLAARPDFAQLAASHGIEFTPLGNPYKSVMRDQEVAAAVGSGSLRKIIKQASDPRQRQVFFERLDTDTMKAVEGAEAVIYKSSWIPFYAYAQKLGVPCVAAVVHHGGAGTTGAGLRAGVPSILTPFVADQPAWAIRVAELGAGPRPIPFKELTAERLADAIGQAVSDATMRESAGRIGERIRAEDGVGAAIEVLMNHVRRGG
jgi:UDP:flavonoid glycosyltransferase YjiC (YdhE family)